MTAVLIVAHAPLASALRAVARHVYPECEPALAALDIAADASPEEAEAQVRAAVRREEGGETLILADVFGATPCKAAQAVASEGAGIRLVTGVNVPMLWRVLCYRDQPLDELVERAVNGAQNGVLPVATNRRQNQGGRAFLDDQVQHHDQQ